MAQICEDKSLKEKSRLYKKDFNALKDNFLANKVKKKYTQYTYELFIK